MPSSPSEIVVLSHLRWDWVWQRPQQLISRIGRGRRTWFVEEPRVAAVETPRIARYDDGQVTVVYLEVPGPERHVGFNDPAARAYATLLPQLLGPSGGRLVWLYTPLALELAEALAPDLLVYDVMDDLGSFLGAPEDLRLREHRAVAAADIVFTGGRSLYEARRARKPGAIHLFPSGVDADHYAPSRALRGRRNGGPPVAGYIGVIDERIDLDLLGGLAGELPDWEIRVVGPVAKIDPASLPCATNLTYPGQVTYDQLPATLGTFDVALMPFALNEATRSISPTKTLEYLAAGLPVVSTRVPDVVSNYAEVVDLRDDARGFAEACRAVREQDGHERDLKVRPLLQWHSWDAISDRMQQLIDRAFEQGRQEEETA